MSDQEYTLVFIKDGGNVLLGYKKRGFGKDLWNGFGGKVEKNESNEEAAVRELHEESGIKIETTQLNYLGYIVFYHKYKDSPNAKLQNGLKVTSYKVHIYTIDKHSKEFEETDEMRPQWFKFQDIPYGDMWPDARLWYPSMLRNEKLSASCTYIDNVVVSWECN